MNWNKSYEEPGRPQKSSQGTKMMILDSPNKRKKSCAALVQEILAKRTKKQSVVSDIRTVESPGMSSKDPRKLPATLMVL